jgi:hypothetical protein
MRYCLHADGEKHLQSRRRSPRKLRKPTGTAHAVAVPGPATVTVCGLPTEPLHAFPDTDFETSPGQMMCRSCREIVASS